ncbi:MAG: hypothetical protein VCE12_20195, partial [Candidatus Latescibacterota bacterium]
LVLLTATEPAVCSGASFPRWFQTSEALLDPVHVPAVPSLSHLILGCLTGGQWPDHLEWLYFLQHQFLIVL